MVVGTTVEHAQFPEAPELDVLDLKACNGKAVPTHPGYISNPKKLVVRSAPSEHVFRAKGYRWILFCTSQGKTRLGTNFRYKELGVPTKGLPLHQLDPWAIHWAAAKHNWDERLREPYQMIRSPNCDLGTALMLFWRAGAGFLQQWATLDDVPDVHQDNWEFVQEIEKRVLAGEFQTGWIYFAPADEGGAYEELSHLFVRRVPAALRQPTGTSLRPRSDSPLIQAIEARDFARVCSCLQAGEDPLGPDSSGARPLLVAIHRGFREAFATFLDRAAVRETVVWHEELVTRRDLAMLATAIERVSPDPLLPLAAAESWLEGVVTLLDAGAALEALPARGMRRTALFTAVSHGNVPIAELLLSRGADPNASVDDDSALGHAVYKFFSESRAEYMHVACRLLDFGAKGLSRALDWCGHFGPGAESEGLFERLVREAVASEDAMRAALHAGRKTLHMPWVNLALAHQQDLNAPNEYGWRPLDMVLPNEDVPCTDLSLRKAIWAKLIALGADPTLRDRNGKTPLEKGRALGFR